MYPTSRVPTTPFPADAAKRGIDFLQMHPDPLHTPRRKDDDSWQPWNPFSQTSWNNPSTRPKQTFDTSSLMTVVPIESTLQDPDTLKLAKLVHEQQHIIQKQKKDYDSLLIELNKVKEKDDESEGIAYRRPEKKRKPVVIPTSDEEAEILFKRVKKLRKQKNSEN